MTKSEFEKIVDDLVSRLNMLTLGDNREISRIIGEFKAIIRKYSEFLNPFVDEDLGRVEHYLKESRRYKRYSLKNENWNKAIDRLSSDIESMKHENTFRE